jgi:hypothetical protein
VLVLVARGRSVLEVKVITGTGDGVGVRVRVGVRVGLGVMVGVSETVAVGAVDVGKGPSSALEVSAMAVRVRLASRGSISPVERLETKRKSITIKPISNTLVPTICTGTRFSLKKLKFTRSALLACSDCGDGCCAVYVLVNDAGAEGI